MTSLLIGPRSTGSGKKYPTVKVTEKVFLDEAGPVPDGQGRRQEQDQLHPEILFPWEAVEDDGQSDVELEHEAQHQRFPP